MTTMVTAAVRSAVFWQVAAGFLLGTVGTLAARDAQAERQPAPARPAHHWQLDR